MSRGARLGAAGFVGVLAAVANPDLRAEEGKSEPDGEAAPIPIAAMARDGAVDFAKAVLPLLKRSCLGCHHRAEAKGGLVLETPETIAAGGKRGPAAIPGKGGESLLLGVASHSRRPVMPPRQNPLGAPPLSPAELGLV